MRKFQILAGDFRGFFRAVGASTPSHPCQLAKKKEPTATLVMGTDDSDHSDGVGDESKYRERYPTWKLIIIAVSWIGVQMIWSSEYAAATPFFQDHLGLDAAKAQGIWIAGPITGLLVQPLVGSLSDQCTSKLGRRRPFIIVGTICVVAGSILFSNCEKIAGKGTTGATVIAIAAFWLMDLSINTIQGPLRALLSDMAAPDQQGYVQTFASLFQGVGQIAGFFLYSSYSDPSDNISVIFLVAYVTLSTTVFISLFISKEIPLAASEVKHSLKERITMPFVNTYYGILSMPNAMVRVAIVQVFTWFAWFCLNTLMTSWWGHDIMHGDPNGTDEEQARFAKGTQMGGRAGVYQACVQLCFSFCLPVFLKKMGIKLSYIMCIVITGGCFLAAYLVYSPLYPPPQSTVDGAYAAIAMTGVGLAATNIFPFVLVGLIFTNPSNKGLNMGVLNVFIVIPQLVDTQYTGVITDYFGGERFAILVGAGWWVIACIAAMFLHVPNTPPAPKPDSQINAALLGDVSELNDSNEVEAKV